MRFAVVTKVPDNTTDRGNLAMVNLPLFIDPQVIGGSFEDPPIPAEKHLGQLILFLQSPVFHLGEVLILDDDGREPHGLGRKPSKWSVEVEYFENVEDAVRCSSRIQ